MRHPKIFDQKKLFSGNVVWRDSRFLGGNGGSVSGRSAEDFVREAKPEVERPSPWAAHQIGGEFSPENNRRNTQGEVRAVLANSLYSENVSRTTMAQAYDGLSFDLQTGVPKGVKNTALITQEWLNSYNEIHKEGAPVTFDELERNPQLMRILSQMFLHDRAKELKEMGAQNGGGSPYRQPPQSTRHSAPAPEAPEVSIKTEATDEPKPWWNRAGSKINEAAQNLKSSLTHGWKAMKNWFRP